MSIATEAKTIWVKGYSLCTVIPNRSRVSKLIFAGYSSGEGYSLL
jgi:hypothetical protein